MKKLLGLAIVLICSLGAFAQAQEKKDSVFEKGMKNYRIIDRLCRDNNRVYDNHIIIDFIEDSSIIMRPVTYVVAPMDSTVQPDGSVIYHSPGWNSEKNSTSPSRYGAYNPWAQSPDNHSWNWNGPQSTPAIPGQQNNPWSHEPYSYGPPQNHWIPGVPQRTNQNRLRLL